MLSMKFLPASVMFFPFLLSSKRKKKSPKSLTELTAEALTEVWRSWVVLRASLWRPVKGATCANQLVRLKEKQLLLCFCIAILDKQVQRLCLPSLLWHTCGAKLWHLVVKWYRTLLLYRNPVRLFYYLCPPIGMQLYSVQSGYFCILDIN